MCSTPFGVNAVITLHHWQTIDFLAGAQRLSASMRSSQYGPRAACARELVLNAFRRQCGHHASSPSSQSIASSRVLNAFRRQCGHHRPNGTSSLADRCSTPFGVNAVITPFDSQQTKPLSSAQRLSASMRSSPPASPNLGRKQRVVLNAFRRQCGHHASTALAGATMPGVLNAFRRQCGHHPTADQSPLALK